MRLACFVFCVAVTATVSPIVRADEPDHFATFAYDSKTGEYWFSYGLESKEKAEEEAKKRAKDPSHLTLATFKNCYCALAIASNGRTFGVGSGEGPLLAQQAALKDCHKKTNRKCTILLTLHTAQGVGGDSYSAIAFSPSTGRYGVSVAKASKSEAETEAISQCHASDAKVVGTSKNGCVALATGKKKSVYGVGTADTEKEAQEKAIEDCKKKTTDVKIAVSLTGKK